MNFFRCKVMLGAALFALVMATAGYADVCGVDNQVYCQEFDHTGNAYSSQNDTAGFGLFAQVYDNFMFETDTVLQSIHFEGAYFNPPEQGSITAWTVQIWDDAGGQPGMKIAEHVVQGNGMETFDGNFGGFPFYTYWIDLPDWNLLGGTQYWVSVYPDLAFPPQWGWGSSADGDGLSYQDFFGDRTPLATDMAFSFDGNGQNGVPEPGTLVMLGTGALGLAGVIRRKLL